MDGQADVVYDAERSSVLLPHGGPKVALQRNIENISEAHLFTLINVSKAMRSSL
jgi:hypothetical protein